MLAISPQQVRLEGSTFTTCPSENPAWQMSAEEISLSEDEAWGEAWHAKFELFGVPVLYIPYINFPVTEERKSGFLFPTFRSSQKNGFEVVLLGAGDGFKNFDSDILVKSSLFENKFLKVIAKLIDRLIGGLQK